MRREIIGLQRTAWWRPRKFLQWHRQIIWTVECLRTVEASTVPGYRSAICTLHQLHSPRTQTCLWLPPVYIVLPQSGATMLQSAVGKLHASSYLFKCITGPSLWEVKRPRHPVRFDAPDPLVFEEAAARITRALTDPHDPVRTGRDDMQVLWFRCH